MKCMKLANETLNFISTYLYQQRSKDLGHRQVYMRVNSSHTLVALADEHVRPQMCVGL